DPAVGLPDPSSTFHGRDLFAPAAARLLRGEPPSRLGTALSDPVALSLPQGGWSGGVLRGEVLYVDPFGNLITSIPNETVGAGAAFQLQTGDGRRRVRVRPAYRMGEPGEVLLVAGSDGTLEIALREGDAAAMTGLRGGAPVRLHPEDAPARPHREREAPA
ncbi:MAG: SAM hydrolase/SAM-dependent halogenase family protein, partial [Gemmatimonadales bacterium]